MREFWILTRLQLLSLFGVNQIRYQKAGEEKKKGKRNLRVLLVMVVALLYLSVVYSMMLAEVFEPLGLLSLMLGLMAMASSMLILVFSMFEAKSMLYGFGDYDMVMSWPVPAQTVAAARAANMYICNLAYGLLLLLPAGVIYALRAAPPLWYYPVFLLILALLPCVPTMLGAFLGTLITLATARMKKSSVWSTVGQFILMIVLVAAIMWMNSGMLRLGEKAASISSAALAYYPPAAWIQSAVSGEALPLVWFVVSAAAAMALMLPALGRIFTGVHGRMSDLPRGRDFFMSRQGRSGVVRALYRKEWKRYTASSLYVTNTAFGHVMLLALGVASVAVKNEIYPSILSDASMRPLMNAVPLAVGAIIAMSATTGSAISIEGRQLWIVRTLPVRARELFLGKILVSLTLAVPTALIAGTLLAIGLRLETRLWPWMYITPLASALFSAVFGLTVNLSLPRLDWTNEAEVVKQSGAMAASMFGAFGCLIALAAAVAVTGLYWTLPAATLALAAASLIIWNGLCRRGEERLRAL